MQGRKKIRKHFNNDHFLRSNSKNIMNRNMPYKLLIACLLLCSCSSSRMIETALYFGQTRPDGSMIKESEWNSFKENHIAKVFANGSSTISCTGNWLDPVTHKLITEPSYIVLCEHKRSMQISRQIDSLTNLYKVMFNQQSVLRVDKKVKAFF